MAKKDDQSYVLTLPMATTKLHNFILDKTFEVSRSIQNACLNEIVRRNRVVHDNRSYQKNARWIKAIKEKIQRLRNDKTINALEKELRSIYNQQKEIEYQFGLTEYSIHHFVVPMKRHYEGVLDINTAQKIASRAWKAYEKVRYGSGKQVSFKPYGTVASIEGKTNSSGITFREANGQYVVKVVNTKVPVKVKSIDMYAKEALLNLKNIKYCRIIRKMIRGKMRYFVQIVIKGIPPAKRDRNTGKFKVRLGEGRTGIDPGTQTMAVVSDKVALLRELAPDVDKLEREKRVILRKMDRSKRATNPQKFYSDGTYKTGNRERWKFSNNYIKLRNKLQDIHRKQAAKRRQSHCRLANVILRTGNKFFVETMNYQALQKRANESKISQKTGKYQRKKRFGKSLANKAPALFVSILEYKCKYLGACFHKINTWSVKASQYNHQEDEYEKKKIQQRWSQVGHYTVQRDLYSAFLIKNFNETLEKIDKTLCEQTFNHFIMKHDLEIQRLKAMKTQISSMGIKV